jgi:multiple sugar transport system substrate-binding protein
VKRSLTLAAVGLSAAVALSACSSSKSSSSAPSSNGSSAAAGGKAVTISLLAPSYGSSDKDDTKLYWQQIINDFQAKYPNIHVDLQMATWDNLATKLTTAVQNNNAPDLFEGGGYADVAAQGLLYKASDIVSPDTLSDLIPHVADLGKTKGADGQDGQYGIPFTTSTRAFFYNTQLFQQAGITAAPQTWADVAADAAKIKALGKTGFGLPLGSEEAQAETYLWTLGNGGGYKDASGKWAVNSAQNIQTFQWLTDNLVKPGLTEADPGTKKRTDLWKDFANGNIGMINGSPALIPILKQGSIGDNWKSVAIPGKSAPLTSPLGVADFIEAFNTHPDHKDAVGKFLDFALQKKYQEQFDNEYFLLPATQSAAAELSTQTPALKPFIDALPSAAWYPSSDPAWDPTSQKIKDIVGKAVTSDPKGILDQIQAVATSSN